MSEEVEMTPITPEEGGGAPPKVTPVAVAASSTAPTVKLKPVIRKPMIRKPVIGGAKPVTLKPAAGTPPPPAPVPEAAAAPVAAPAAAAPAAAPSVPPVAPAPGNGPQLKAITSPIAAQAILRKTGIIAEGILTPAQAQAAKTKTSRISLESAIGVAPVMKSSAPMKTIKLRRPTDIPPAPGAVKLPSVKPAPAPAQASVAAPAAPEAAAAAPTAAPAAEPVATEAAPAAESAESPTTVTQKKTLKLKRPGFKRPTVSGLHRPGETPAAPAPADGTGGEVPALSAVAAIPDIKPLPSVAPAPAEDDSKTVAGVPAWLNATTLVAGIAALVVIGLCTWTLFREAVGPAAGPNDLASFHSDTDYRR